MLIAQSIADQTYNFSKAFVRENVTYGYNIVTPFCFREIQCKKMDVLMFYQRFQRQLSWNKEKYAIIAITHVCFIALTLARSLDV